MSQGEKRGLLVVVGGFAGVAVVAALNGGALGTGWDIYKTIFTSARSDAPTRSEPRSILPDPEKPNRTASAAAVPLGPLPGPSGLPTVVPSSNAATKIAPTAYGGEKDRPETTVANLAPAPSAKADRTSAPPSSMKSMDPVKPSEHPDVAARPSDLRKEIMVVGRNPFRICDHGGFQATIASGGGAVILTSRNRQLPDSRMSGWERIVAVGTKTVLFGDCEVTVELKDMLQDKIIVISESAHGGDKT